MDDCLYQHGAGCLTCSPERYVEEKNDCFYQCEAGCISCHPERYIALGSCESEPTPPVRLTKSKQYAEPAKSTLKEWIKNKKQEKKMNYMNSNYAVACCPPQTEQKQEKIYMVERLTMLKNEKTDELRQKFNLEDDAPPQTAEDFLKRIADGQYKLREKTNWLTSFHDRVMWRDPNKEVDLDGFNAAYEELEDAFENTMDEVVVLPEVDGLAALNEFKALN